MPLDWPRSREAWWRVVRRTWNQAIACEVPARCGELAYAFLFAVFPLLYFLTNVIGYAATTKSGMLYRSLLSYLRGVSPSPAITNLLEGTLGDISRGRGGMKLLLSLGVALWAASSGTLAYGRILTDVGGWKETRSWWWRRILAIILTLAFGVLSLTALLLVLYGREIGEAFANQIDQGPVFIAVWHLLKWPIALVFMLFSYDLVYNFAPGHRSKLHWVTPGACIAIAMWLLASFGLRVYLAAVPPSSAYGSIGAVILLMIWFWITALSILVGGLVNVEIEPLAHKTAVPVRRSSKR